jgi:hypothetical protein
MVRAALQTISTWQSNYDMLFHNDLLPIVNRRAHPGARWEHWDTPPIAGVLRDASQGFPEHPMLGSILPDITEEAKHLMTDRGFKLQRYIVESLEKALFPDSIPELIKRRLQVMQPDILFEDIDLDGAKQLLVQLSPAWATSILKTWANGWTTSSRMHEPISRDCLFGCGGIDSLHHYLRCHRLQHLLRAHGEPDLSEVLLLARPTEENAYLLVVAFLAYHEIKQYPTADDTRISRTIDAARAHATCTRRLPHLTRMGDLVQGA